MDEETVKMLEAEIEELNRVDGVCESVDGADGFGNFVKTLLDKLNGRAQGPHGASSVDTASGSSYMKDFQEYKTSYVAEETKHKGQGDDGDVYDFTHQNRGLAIIINNEDFDQNSEFGPRPGSSYDEVALYQTFKKLGFKVLVKRNLTAEQMLQLLKIAKDHYAHKNADCFVCSILTHGNEVIAEKANDFLGSRVRRDVLFGTDGLPVLTKSVVEYFNDEFCPGLQGKPRLFFLQACRGSKYDHGVNIEVSKSAEPHIISTGRRQDKIDGRNSPVDQPDNRTTKRQTSFSSSVDPPEYHQHLIDSTDANPSSSREEKQESQSTGRSFSSFKMPGVFCSKTSAYNPELHLARVRDVPACPTPLYKDCLVMYSTPPGHYAWRRKNGAWFVQSLCEVLNSPEIGQVSLLKALVEVSYKVAFNYQSENPSRPDMHQKKEIPVIESMLVKDIYLT